MDLMDYFKSVISLICTKVQTGECDILLDLRNQILILRLSLFVYKILKFFLLYLIFFYNFLRYELNFFFWHFFSNP